MAFRSIIWLPRRGLKERALVTHSLPPQEEQWVVRVRREPDQETSHNFELDLLVHARLCRCASGDSTI